MAKKWTNTEIEILKENYPNMDINELIKLFNGRSKNSIDNKANDLKLKKKKLIPKEGYKYCKKCGRELPNTNIYFPIDKSCVDGLRSVCRECGKDGHFMEEGYIPKEWWSDEDNKLFLERYPFYTNEEMRNLFYPNLTDKQMFDRAWKHSISKNEETYWKGREQQASKVSGKLKGRIFTEEHRQKIRETKLAQNLKGENCPWKGLKRSNEYKAYLSKRNKEKGQWSGKSNPRHINPLKGSDNGRWQGGITNLYQFLRENITYWKEKSMKFCNFKCVLTGDSFDNIHHLTPFKDIVYEALNKLNIEVEQDISNYTEEIRKQIINEVENLHIKYGIGLCLCKEIHKKFHDTYNYTNFSKEDFKEFIDRYFKGEFDNDLSDKHKSINSKVNYEEITKKCNLFYYVEN